MIADVDACVAHLTTELMALGGAIANLVLVFTSDRGGEGQAKSLKSGVQRVVVHNKLLYLMIGLFIAEPVVRASAASREFCSEGFVAVVRSRFAQRCEKLPRDIW